MRRVAPRPLRAALDRALHAAEPDTPLARVQGVWPEVAGAALAAEARPAAARAGVVTVHCSSAVWAQELELLGGDLRTRLNERLERSGAPAVTRLRFVVGSEPNPD